MPEEPTDSNFNVLTQSVVFGTELSEANTLYAEWFGIFSDGLEDEFVVSIFNIGIDHYLTDNFVIDVRAGVGLTDDSGRLLHRYRRRLPLLKPLSVFDIGTGWIESTARWAGADEYA